MDDPGWLDDSEELELDEREDEMGEEEDEEREDDASLERLDEDDI
jgi:hypothetical protein